MVRNKLILLAVFFLSITSNYAQKIESFLHNQLIVKVGDICEESMDDNPCMGSQLYLLLYFDNKKVEISELEINSCNEESRFKIGVYAWRLKSNNKIEIESLPLKLPLAYVEVLFLELMDKRLVGQFKFPNGKTQQLIFNEKPTD